MDDLLEVLKIWDFMKFFEYGTIHREIAISVGSSSCVIIANFIGINVVIRSLYNFKISCN